MPRSAHGPPLVAALALLFAPATARAADPFAECDAKVKADPGDRDAYRCYWSTALNNGDLAGARARLEAHVATRPEDPYPLRNLAAVAADMGADDREALTLRALNLLKKAGDHRSVVFSYLNIANQKRSAADLEGALAALDGAEEAAEIANDNQLRGTVKMERGRFALRVLRQLHLAEARFEEAAALFGEDTPDPLLHRFLGLRASLESKRGRLKEAVALMDQAVEVTRRMENRYAEISARVNGLTYRLGLYDQDGSLRPPDLLERSRALLQDAQEAGHPYAEMHGWCFVAEFAPPDEGLEAAEKCMALGIKLEDHAQAQQGRIHTSRILSQTGRDHARAETIAQQDLERSLELDDWQLAYNARVSLHSVAWRAGKADLARARAEELFEAMEVARDLNTDEQDRAGTFSRDVFILRRHVGWLLRDPERREARIGEAFQSLERARARLLLESVQPGARAEVDAYRAAMDAAAKGDDALSREQLHQVLATARQRARALFPPASLEEVQTNLDPDEALVLYTLSNATPNPDGSVEEGSWAITVTRDSATAVELPDRRELVASSRVFLGLIGERDADTGAAQARLFERWVAPAIASLPAETTKLVLVLDGPLHLLPVESLIPAEGAPVDARFQASRSPSATLWNLERQVEHEAPKGGGVLALADPDLPPAATSAGFDLEPLPAARAEIQAIGAPLAKRAILLQGAEATETALLERSSDWPINVVHVAAHAVVEHADPTRSAIVLAADGGSDGLVSAAELREAGLDGATLMLSACQTADGALIDGEGVMSFARAGLEAGAPVVVATLWPVRDEDSKALFASIYGHLYAGESVATAVQRTRESMRAAGQPLEVHGAIVVVGEGEHVPFPDVPVPPEPDDYVNDAPGRWWIFGGLAFAALGALGFAVFRGRG